MWSPGVRRSWLLRDLYWSKAVSLHTKIAKLAKNRGRVFREHFGAADRGAWISSLIP
jgi:hypothetical protein